MIIRCSNVNVNLKMYYFLYNNRIKIREIKERSLQNLTRDYINHHTRSEMVEKEMQKDLSRADMMNLLDSLYSKSIQGIPMISSPIEKNVILMVINLTNEFFDEAKEKADENGIILINGLTFASLLVRYGIEVDIR